MKTRIAYKLSQAVIWFCETQAKGEIRIAPNDRGVTLEVTGMPHDAFRILSTEDLLVLNLVDVLAAMVDEAST